MRPGSEHSPDLPPDTGRDCAWVKEHLGVYDLWDDSLSQVEFGAIERHLRYCPACASEYADIRRAREVIQMTMAGLDRDAWAREKTAFAAEILARLRGAGLFEREEAAPPESLPLAVPGADRPLASPRSDPHRGPGRWKRPLAMAASLLLTFALPVLAFVGVHHLLSVHQAPESRVETWEGGAATATPAQLAGTKGDNPLPRAVADLNAGYPDAAPDIGEHMDSVAYAAIRDFELVALLPDTEEEYEAWARKEYPHVMALYDVLTEVDPDDLVAKPFWDGQPVNIPPWGERLYEGVPEAERPVGWRALLIYSGEILKFDFPENLSEANCRPTLEALQRAAAVAGFSAEYSRNDDVPALPEADAPNEGMQHFAILPLATEAANLEFRLRDMPDSYAARLVGNIPLATSTLRYFILGGKLLRAPSFDEFTQKASKLLRRELYDRAIHECDARDRLQLFDALLDSRGASVEHLTHSRNE